MSTKTGIAPFWNIGFTVVGNPAATVITSSPALMAFSLCKWEVNEEKANKLAEDPELTVIKCLMFKKFASFNWN